MSLTGRLIAGEVFHIAASVVHARRGPHRHSFRHVTDYLLLAPDHARDTGLFARNRFNLLAVHDRDHGGARGAGAGPDWARARLAEAGLPAAEFTTIALLTQPRTLGHWFTPVSFWMALRDDAILAVIAEVNNTFGQRHSYLCSHGDFAPVRPDQTIRAAKVFHVSPFQDVAGEYRFAFALSPERLAIRITQVDGGNGVDAALSGALRPLTAGRALGAVLRRPGGGLRVLALIYWHALRLKLGGVAYRRLPAPPERDIS